MPLATLELAWASHGFLRVHRSYLVALRFIAEVARDPLGGQVVRVAGHDLPVSRRQAAELRERVRVLPRRAGQSGEPG
jgi:DNA-binding LytR/AlgR family response regulator